VRNKRLAPDSATRDGTPRLYTARNESGSDDHVVAFLDRKHHPPDEAGVWSCQHPCDNMSSSVACSAAATSPRFRSRRGHVGPVVENVERPDHLEAIEDRERAVGGAVIDHKTR